MKSSEILRKAARLVELGRAEFGCHAIEDASGGFFGPAWNDKVMRAYRVVAPRSAREGDAWWDWDEPGPRIIGLCLAAAIAESEGD